MNGRNGDFRDIAPAAVISPRYFGVQIAVRARSKVLARSESSSKLSLYSEATMDSRYSSVLFLLNISTRGISKKKNKSNVSKLSSLKGRGIEFVRIKFDNTVFTIDAFARLENEGNNFSSSSRQCRDIRISREGLSRGGIGGKAKPSTPRIIRHIFLRMYRGKGRLRKSLAVVPNSGGDLFKIADTHK